MAIRNFVFLHYFDAKNIEYIWTLNYRFVKQISVWTLNYCFVKKISVKLVVCIIVKYLFLCYHCALLLGKILWF